MGNQLCKTCLNYCSAVLAKMLVRKEKTWIYKANFSAGSSLVSLLTTSTSFLLGCQQDNNGFLFLYIFKQHQICFSCCWWDTERNLPFTLVLQSNFFVSLLASYTSLLWRSSVQSYILQLGCIMQLCSKYLTQLFSQMPHLTILLSIHIHPIPSEGCSLVQFFLQRDEST